MKKKWIAGGLAAALILVCLVGRMSRDAAQEGLMEGIHTKKQEGLKLADAGEETEALTDFGMRLFAECIEEAPQENMLISPLSVAEAFGMVLGGAEGTSKAQIEEVIGMDAQTLNQYIYSYCASLPQGENYKLTDANSIWIRDMEGLEAKQEFLQANADWYGSDAYKEPFDKETCDKINAWVDTHTDGMIRQILDEIPESAMLYLINALVFDAQWEVIYEPYQVWEDETFTTADGGEVPVSMMHCAEEEFLEDELATGFIKYYKDHSYAYVALLPNEGVSAADYAKTLTGAHVQELLANPTQITVNTGIPVYTAETTVLMEEMLQKLGMRDVFDAVKADLSGMASAPENLFISRVLHKTYIEVDAKGTKAAAMTEMEVADGCDAPAVEEKTVILNRPFVYMIVDCKQKLPVFVGVLNHI